MHLVVEPIKDRLRSAIVPVRIRQGVVQINSTTNMEPVVTVAPKESQGTTWAGCRTTSPFKMN